MENKPLISQLTQITTTPDKRKLLLEFLEANDIDAIYRNNKHYSHPKEDLALNSILLKDIEYLKQLK